MSRPLIVLVIVASIPWSAYPQAAAAPPPLWLAIPPADSLASSAAVSGVLLRRLPADDSRHALVLIPGTSLSGGDIGVARAPLLGIRGSRPTAPGVYLDGAPVRQQAFGGQAVGIAPAGVEVVAVTTGIAGAAVADAAGGVISYQTRSGGERLAGDVRWDSDEPFGDGMSVGFNRIEGTAGGSLGGRVRFFAAATLYGQRSQYRGLGSEAIPTYLPFGVDTTIDISGTSIPIPAFTTADQGIRRPFDWSAARQVHGRLDYSYGGGSSLAVTLLGGDYQQRVFPGRLLLDPAMYEGRRTRALIGIANWRHRLAAVGGAPAVLDLNLALAGESDVGGPLQPGSEIASRDPYLGIAFETLEFSGLDVFALPVTEQLVRNVRTNTGQRTPYLNREDLRLRQPHRLNPYGMVAGWPTEGMDGTLAHVHERRLNGRLRFEWLPGRHQVQLGVNAEHTTVSLYQSSLLRQAFMDVFRERPQRWGVFAGDRVAVGDRALVEVGLRYDRYAPGGEFPNVPGRIYTHPDWSLNAATSDSAYANAVARVFTPARTQAFVSPRLRAAFSVAPRATLRLGYSRSVEPPPWALFFRGANNDLDFTNTSNLFGRDVEFGVGSLIEVGARVDAGSGVSVDVALYQKGLPGYAGRVMPFADPLNPSDSINLYVLTSLRAADILGLDAKVHWRPNRWLEATAAYSLADAEGESGTPKHAIAAAAAVHAPEDWKPGSVLGAIGRGASAVVFVRAVSGARYTRLQNQGQGTLAPSDAFPGLAVEPFNASRLPWMKWLDVRIAKPIRAAGRSWEVFADVRNLLNLRNISALFAETGDVVNDEHRTQLLAGEYANLKGEATSNGALDPDGSTINLSGCGTWADPVNCVTLSRVERRFGNGDGLYTLAEQERALNAFYDAFFGPWRFYSAGRTLRVGAQLAF